MDNISILLDVKLWSETLLGCFKQVTDSFAVVFDNRPLFGYIETKQVSKNKYYKIETLHAKSQLICNLKNGGDTDSGIVPVLNGLYF